ncbi:MAG: M20/M25/M40 family metallo-hydrolase [Oscillospiraceae bacterium]|nr:M20/M25/M40 family metallo-hydrolase [Oscillospiraceae bacterium]
MLELTKALCAMGGVSGDEGEVRDFIRARAAPHSDEIREDALGNLLVFQRGAQPDSAQPDSAQPGGGRPLLMLCAHMDEVGLIVKGITDEGMLRFGCVGGIDRRVLPGCRVLVGGNKVPGVVGLKACHLSSREEEEKIPKLEDMLIDIGASDRKEAEQAAALGDTCVFHSPIAEVGDGYLMARAIDDRFGCACLLRRLAERRPRCDTWTVFTAQEEAGTRGAYAAVNQVAPDIAVIVEATTAADLPDLPPHKRVCKPGGGVVIPTMDGGAVYTPRLVALARALADGGGIPWQDKEYLSGGTDARAIQIGRAGVEVLGLALATRYLHSPSSMAKISDMEHVYHLLDTVAEAL